VQAPKELRLPFRIRPDGACRLTEQIDRAGRLAEVLQAIRAEVPDVLADDDADFPRQCAEHPELVILV
jgi:hypothetical protein